MLSNEYLPEAGFLTRNWQSVFQAQSSVNSSEPAPPAFGEACDRIWYIVDIPAAFAILLLFSLLLRPVFVFQLPIWIRNFVKEEVKSVDEPDVLVPRQRLHLLSFEILLSFLSALGLLTTVLAIVAKVPWNFTIPHAVSWGVALLYVAAVRPRTVSGALLFIYILIMSAGLTLLLNGNRFTDLETASWSVSTALAGLSMIACFLMPLRHPSLPADGISKVFTAPDSALRSPEDNLTLWQWMTVSWMKPMMAAGKTRQLNEEDVWSLGYEFDHARLHEAFRLIKGSVFRRLMLANGLDLIITTSLAILQMFSQFAIPVLLQQLLKSMQNPDAPRRATLVFTILSLTSRMVYTQSDVFKLWYTRRVYERSRGEMITMLYEKTLQRKVIGETVDVGDKKGEKSASTGKVLNIIRGDAYEVAQRFWDWPDLVTKPLGLIIAVTLVWKLIGAPALLGILVFGSFQLLNILITRILLRYEKKRRAATDEKLKITTQFIEAIRHLRYNSWEGKWRDGILSARDKELNIRLKSGFFSVLLTASNSLATGLFPVFSFLALTLIAKQRLTVDIAFPALQLFTMLESNLQEIPNLITTILNAWVAIGRIEAFMKEPERENLESDGGLSNKAPHISLQDVSFAWPGREEAVLKDVSLEIPPGMTAVHGKVGAGKSALLQALLGELDVINGEFRPPDSMIAYCGQTPWLQNMSIRDNILFGYPFDRERYTAVLSACALTTDLASFTNGDLSFIGENGIGLSGGQKARVSLARAVYSSSPLLFLDDPISALDQQTAEHIMQQCIGGSLCRDRSVLLVTHRLDLVRGMVNKVINVDEGRCTIDDADLIQLENENADIKGKDEKKNDSTNPIDDGKTTDKTADAIKDKFVEDEQRAHGGVKFRVYWEYIKAGRISLWLLLLFTMILSRFSSVAEIWFLKAWGESYDRVDMTAITDPFKSLPSPEVDVTPWLIGFSVLAVLQSITYAFFRMNMVFIMYSAGKSIFRSIMLRIGNATFRFYDVTPVGRLMNRMTSDIGTVDGPIGYLLFGIGFCIVGWAMSIVVIASITPVFFIFATLTTIAFVWIFGQFLPTSQNLRRLEMVSLSPLMANFGTLIEGLITVRAFRAQRRFQEGVIRAVDTFQKMDHFYWSLQTWLQFRFNILSSLVTFGLTLLAIFTNVSPGLTAFMLNYATTFVRNTHGMCKMYGQLELNFTSVERIIELFDVEQEPSGDQSPPAAWPTKGDIVFEKVNIRYAPHLDLVLKNVNLHIPGGSNVAITGRTGSGKSTMALSLLATVRPESGLIKVDGIDICSLKPSELRRRITFLAQEPTLFVGSMRMNLDPLEEFSDEECTAVLARLSGDRHGWTLETHVEGGGKNLSQGQRQLVQLARAILRRSPLVILDEATASIDLGTSIEVQDVLRQELGRSTVITIAHRVEAVSNADWCIELAHGRLVAQGPPGQVERFEIPEEGNGDDDSREDQGTNTGAGNEPSDSSPDLFG